MLRAGFQKAYIDDACIFHSHRCTPEERYNAGVVINNGPIGNGPIGASNGGTFWGQCGEFFNNCGQAMTAGNRNLFQSDHCFDNFISPVTNPFYFEDPRSLTEIRPIFMYQSTPGSNYIFHGGDVEWFGMQARLALTERLSFIMSEFGFIWLEPEDYGFVRQWRMEAEERSKAEGKSGMSAEAVTRFVDAFLPAYAIYTPRLRERSPVPDGAYLHLVVGRDRLPVPCAIGA